jgi:hypothetical protein
MASRSVAEYKRFFKRPALLEGKSGGGLSYSMQVI